MLGKQHVWLLFVCNLCSSRPACVSQDNQVLKSQRQTAWPLSSDQCPQAEACVLFGKTDFGTSVVDLGDLGFSSCSMHF